MSFPKLIYLLGLLIYMGITKNPRIRMYWEKGNHQNEFVISKMGRERFKLLLKCIHLSDIEYKNY